MNKDHVKIGIIGFGRMGITHYSIINSYPGVVINSVADTSGITLSMLGKYIDGVATYKDYKKLIDKSKPDGIVVCTPPHLHYDILKYALERDIHVFVEKPYTVNPIEASELSDQFKAKNLVNQVGYVNRFNDVFSSVKEHLDAGVIGTAIKFRSEMYSSTVIREDKGNGWRGNKKTGGGVVFEMAAHAIDLVNFYFGKPKTVVGTFMNSIYSKKVNDIVSSTFLYENGFTGTINVNWSDQSYRKPTNKIEILGTKGKILADQHSFKLYLNEELEERDYRKGWNSVYITDIFKQVPFYVRGNEFTRQLYHFVDCIKDNTIKNLSSFADATSTQEVIDELYDDYTQNLKKLNGTNR